MRSCRRPSRRGPAGRPSRWPTRASSGALLMSWYQGALAWNMRPPPDGPGGRSRRGGRSRGSGSRGRGGGRSRSSGAGAGAGAGRGSRSRSRGRRSRSRSRRGGRGRGSRSRRGGRSRGLGRRSRRGGRSLGRRSRGRSLGSRSRRGGRGLGSRSRRGGRGPGVGAGAGPSLGRRSRRDSRGFGRREFGSRSRYHQSRRYGSRRVQRWLRIRFRGCRNSFLNGSPEVVFLFTGAAGAERHERAGNCDVYDWVGSIPQHRGRVGSWPSMSRKTCFQAEKASCWGRNRP